MRPLLAILLPALLLGGCAPTPIPTAVVREDSALEKEVRRLTAEQTVLNRRIEQLSDNLLLLEGRVQDHQLLLRELRAAATAQKVTPGGEKTGNIPPAPGAQAQEAANGKPGAATEIYLEAFADFASGHYQEAISGFENFLRLFPGNDYAGHAFYWLGACYYAQQQYPAALDAFRQGAEQFPQGGKAPESLLQMAATLRQMGRGAEAEETMRVLRERYPDATAAHRTPEKNQ